MIRPERPVGDSVPLLDVETSSRQRVKYIPLEVELTFMFRELMAFVLMLVPAVALAALAVV